MKFLERLNNTELELSGLNRWLGKKTFRRTTFYESLAGMIRDGTPVMRALEFICDVETDFGKKKGQSGLYFLATDCIASIRSSGQLSPALKDWVPKDEIALIRNGEERGDIAEAMFQVVKTAKGRQEMISSLVSVCLYPLILLTLCVVNMYNVHTRVIPMISAFAPEERWSVQMVILAKSSGLVIGYGLWLLAGLLLLAILIRMSFSLYTGPHPCCR